MSGSALPQSASSTGSSMLDLIRAADAVSPRLKKVQIESAVAVKVASGSKLARKIQTATTSISASSISGTSKSSPKKRGKPSHLKIQTAQESDGELSDPPEVFNTDSEDEKDIITTAVTRIERRMDKSDDDYNPTPRSRRPSTAGSGKLLRANRAATRSRENSFAFSISPKGRVVLDGADEVPRVVLDRLKDPDPAPEAPKRKRGRPRKIVLESPVENDDADSEEGSKSSRRRKVLPLTPPSDNAASPLFSHASSAPPSLSASKRTIEAVEAELALALADLQAARKEIEMLRLKSITLAEGAGDAALQNAKEQIDGLREDVQSLERSRAIDREGWELERGRLQRRIKILEGT